MKVNAVGKDISEVDRAYVAGFLDADGAIMATIERHTEKKFGYRVRVQLKITQRDQLVLEWFQNHFGIGTIRQNRTTHDWIVRDVTEVKHLLGLITPYLKAKKSQAEIATAILATPIHSREDLIKIAQSADALSRFNVRSKNRRKNFASMI